MHDLKERLYIGFVCLAHVSVCSLMVYTAFNPEPEPKPLVRIVHTLPDGTEQTYQTREVRHLVFSDGIEFKTLGGKAVELSSDYTITKIR